LNGWVIVVTLITSAEHNADGSTRLQAFVDVSGPGVPNNDQLHLICTGIANSLATHLGISSTSINCVINPKPVKKRELEQTTTGSYIADLAVNQPSNLQGSSGAIAASGLIIATAAAVAL